MKRSILCAAGITLILRLAVLAASISDSTILSHIQKGLSSGSLQSSAVMLELGAKPTALSTPPSGSSASSSAEQNTEDSQPNITAPTQENPAESAEKTTDLSAYDAQIMETTFTSDTNLAVDNHTSYELNPEALLGEGLTQSLSSDGPQILIIHTHGSEAYTPDGEDIYTSSDNYRTEDTNYNVVRIGDILTEIWDSYGLNVIHDRQLHDYPSYTGSYTRTAESIQSYLEQYPTISIVIDLHRDALGTDDLMYKTVADIEGHNSAQIMIIAGTGELGLYHPYWQENLKLALGLESAMNTSYPTLARPVSVVSERYNQHLTTGSLIIEVGSCGNTLQEAISAIQLFGESTAPLLLSLAE
ncbi:MAG: stage II sporulation protein P [Oscillospiraceae bacterium]